MTNVLFLKLRSYLAWCSLVPSQESLLSTTIPTTDTFRQALPPALCRPSCLSRWRRRCSPPHGLAILPPHEAASCAEASRWVLDCLEVDPVMPEPRIVAHTSVLSTNLLSKTTLVAWGRLGQEKPLPSVSSAGCPWALTELGHCLPLNMLINILKT